MTKPELGLQGVRVLVTGASSGIGHAMADALLRAGATVAASARPGARLDEAVQQWEEEGLPVRALPMDVRDPASVAVAHEELADVWDSLDLLVNNAGLGMRTVNPRFVVEPKPFWEVPLEGFQDVLAVNCTGYFLVAKTFFPLLVAGTPGRIVNITMNHSTMCRQGFVPYGPSRAAAESLSRIMAEDAKGAGVAVNMLLPGGATRTGMIPEELPPSFEDSLLPPEIMGPPIVFLASSRAAGITGERITASAWEAWCSEHGVDPTATVIK
ncbi:MAG: SDR family NAD(P)-dependent oxidoreductase [Candidatus Dormibacteria bacterium]